MLARSCKVPTVWGWFDHGFRMFLVDVLHGRVGFCRAMLAFQTRTKHRNLRDRDLFARFPPFYPKVWGCSTTLYLPGRFLKFTGHRHKSPLNLYSSYLQWAFIRCTTPGAWTTPPGPSRFSCPRARPRPAPCWTSPRRCCASVPTAGRSSACRCRRPQAPWPKRRCPSGPRRNGCWAWNLPHLEAGKKMEDARKKA